jgi:hypothetical protein
MPISTIDIREQVIDVLRGMVNSDVAPEIGDGTDPIRGLGLMSDDGLDFACEISIRLNFHFPDDQNPFVDDSGQRARNVREIVELITPMIAGKKEASHG